MVLKNIHEHFTHVLRHREARHVEDVRRLNVLQVLPQFGRRVSKPL